MTPAELAMCAEAYGEIEEERYRRSLNAAYMCAYWSRVRELKVFDDYIKPRRRKMTDDDMLKTVKALNAMFGGDVNG